LLFREQVEIISTMEEIISEAAVPAAVHEGKYRRKTVLPRPLQAPEGPITTAE
jgi:hypothetical protein